MDSTFEEATERADRIRAGLDSLIQMKQDIVDAWKFRDWIARGYESWDVYIKVEYGNRLPKLGMSQRKDLVLSLRAEDMSTRAIASVALVDKETVRKDLMAGGENSPPAESNVIGTDGKRYPTGGQGPRDGDTCVFADVANSSLMRDLTKTRSVMNGVIARADELDHDELCLYIDTLKAYRKLVNETIKGLSDRRDVKSANSM